MSDRTCPNCAHTIKDGTSTCSCGFSWDDGVEVPSPEIVRTASRRPSAVERLVSEDRATKAAPPPTPPTPPTPKELSVLDDDLDLPPLPWENAGTTGTAPRSETTAGAPAEKAMPRVTDNRPDDTSETAGVIPPSAARYQRPAPAASPVTGNDASAAPRAGNAPARPDAGARPSRQPRAGLLMDCPACGVRISKRAETCPKCTTAPWDHCQICATRILVNSATCPECGDPDPFDAGVDP